MPGRLEPSGAQHGRSRTKDSITARHDDVDDGPASDATARRHPLRYPCSTRGGRQGVRPRWAAALASTQRPVGVRFGAPGVRRVFSPRSFHGSGRRRDPSSSRCGWRRSRQSLPILACGPVWAASCIENDGLRRSVLPEMIRVHRRLGGGPLAQIFLRCAARRLTGPLWPHKLRWQRYRGLAKTG